MSRVGDMDLKLCTLCPYAMHALLADDGWIVYYCERCDGPIGKAAP